MQVEPSEEDILSCNIADLCESPLCHRNDPFFKEIQQALKIKKIAEEQHEYILTEIRSRNHIDPTLEYALSRIKIILAGNKI